MDNKELDEIKSELDAIKLEFHKFTKLKQSEHGTNCMHLECFLPEYNQDWIDFMTQIQKRVEGLITKIDASHDLFLSLTLIKAFCLLRIMIGWKSLDKEKFVLMAEPMIRECDMILNPYKRRAETIWLFVMVQVTHVYLIQIRNEGKYMCCEDCREDNKKAFKIIENAHKEYVDFVRFKMEKPWGIDDIFACFDSDGNQMKSNLADDLEKFHNYDVARLLLRFAVMFNDEPRIMAYAINGLKTYLDGHFDHEILHLFTRDAIMVVQAYVNAHHFVQAQHIAAVVMLTVVKFRRSLPENERTTVNPIQRDASYIYAEYGNRLIRKSHDIHFNKYLRTQGSNSIQVPANFHIDDCERLLPPSPELQVYETIFPTQLTEDPEIFSQLQSKTKQWLKRMKQLERTNTAPWDLCLEPLDMVECRLSHIKSSVSMCSMQ